MIKDFISPEFVTDSKLCEQELQTIEDNNFSFIIQNILNKEFIK